MKHDRNQDQRRHVENKDLKDIEKRNRKDEEKRKIRQGGNEQIPGKKNTGNFDQGGRKNAGNLRKDEKQKLGNQRSKIQREDWNDPDLYDEDEGIGRGRGLDE